MEFQDKSCYLYNISSNTARYHVFRSMYAYQLKRWFKAYSPSQFLFLTNSQVVGVGVCVGVGVVAVVSEDKS